MKSHPARLSRAASAMFVLGLGALLPASAAEDAKQPANSPPEQKSAAPAPAAQPTQSKSASSPAPAAAAPAPAASATVAADAPAPSPVHLAPDKIKDRTDAKLVDRKVFGSDGKRLGTLKDYFVEPSTGEVVYGVVSSGGFAGFHDKYRLVPFKAFKPGKRDGELSIAMNEAQWEQLSTLEEDDYKAGRLTVSDGERRRIAQQFERAQSGAAASGSAFYTANISAHLIRAGQLHDKEIYSGMRELGTIDALVIDPDAGKASALFKPARREFGEPKNHYLVPLERFAFGATEDERATTGLTRNDFETKPAGGSGVALAGAPLSNERQSAASGPAVAPKEGAGAQTVAANAPAKQQGAAASAGATPSAPTAQTSAAAASSAKGETVAAQGTPTAAKQAGQADGQKSAEAASSPASAQARAAPAAGKSGTGTASQEKRPDARSATDEASQVAQQQPAADGDQAKQAKDAATKKPAAHEDSKLAPTGRDPKDADRAVAAVTEAVLMALSPVKVSIEQGKVILRGKVKDETEKKAIEERAREAANGMPIESHLEIEKPE